MALYVIDSYRFCLDYVSGPFPLCTAYPLFSEVAELTNPLHFKKTLLVIHIFLILFFELKTIIHGISTD